MPSGPATGASSPFDPRHSVILAREADSPIPQEALTFDGLERLFYLARSSAGFPQWLPELTHDRRRLAAEDDQEQIPAAVLLALTGNDGPSVVLTQRASHLPTHAGQVSLPGGRAEASDFSEEATALREAQEEIGLKPDRVRLLGRLPDYVTVTGFRVTPVIGRVESDHPAFVPDRSEVAEIFSVPLAFLMNPANHQWRVVPDAERLMGRRVEFYAMPYCSPAHQGREFFIWGATAAMLRNLYRFLHAASTQSASRL